MSLMFTSFSDRPKEELVLAFWNFLKNIKIVNTKLISVEKYRILEI